MGIRRKKRRSFLFICQIRRPSSQTWGFPHQVCIEPRRGGTEGGGKPPQAPSICLFTAAAPLPISNNRNAPAVKEEKKGNVHTHTHTCMHAFIRRTSKRHNKERERDRFINSGAFAWLLYLMSCCGMCVCVKGRWKSEHWKGCKVMKLPFLTPPLPPPSKIWKNSGGAFHVILLVTRWSPLGRHRSALLIYVVVTRERRGEKRRRRKRSQSKQSSTQRREIGKLLLWATLALTYQTKIDGLSGEEKRGKKHVTFRIERIKCCSC